MMRTQEKETEKHILVYEAAMSHGSRSRILQFGWEMPPMYSVSKDLFHKWWSYFGVHGDLRRWDLTRGSGSQGAHC